MKAVSDPTWWASPTASGGISGLDQSGSANSVLIKPGATALTLIPSYISSFDRNITILSRAALVEP